MKSLFIASLIIILTCPLTPQETLTLQQAIETALKNNHSITIAHNEAAIAENNHTRGNAGFLPTLSLNASGNLSNNDTKQKFATGQEVNKKNAESKNISSGLALNWTLFDGMKMFSTYNKFGELSAMSQLQEKTQIENTLAAIINAYYDVVKQKQLIRAIDSTLSIYNERVKMAETSWKIGKLSKMDYLQAKVDRNTQLSAKLRQQNTLQASRIMLNQLLSRPVETEFDVNDSIPLGYKPSFQELKISVTKQNTSLLFLEKNIRVGDLTLKEVRSQYYPRLSLTMNYNFTKTENQVGLTLFNQNQGLNAGLSASWTLFNGFNTNRQYKNAQMVLMNYKLQYDEIRIKMESDLLRAFRNLQQSLEILALEEENVKLAKENVGIAIERFRLANISTLELKEAQKSYEDALTRLVSARYEAKTSETELMRLNADLVK